MREMKVGSTFLLPPQGRLGWWVVGELSEGEALQRVLRVAPETEITGWPGFPLKEVVRLPSQVWSWSDGLMVIVEVGDEKAIAIGRRGTNRYLLLEKGLKGNSSRFGARAGTRATRLLSLCGERI